MEHPVELGWFDYEKVNEAELLPNASELAGVVLPGHASAMHSFVEGEKKMCTKGSSVSFTIVTKDHNGRFLANAGDVIRTKLCEPQEEGSVSANPTGIQNGRKDGTYQISVAPHHEGE